MIIRAKIIMLDTEDKDTVLRHFVHDTGVGPNYGYTTEDIKVNTYVEYQNKHLYFITDGEIEKGDWYYNYISKRIYFHRNTDGDIYEETGRNSKIVATTDPKLKVYDKEVSEEYGAPNYLRLPQPSKEFIEKYCRKGGAIDEVMLELEVNQCDGCQKGLPLVDGVHKDHQMFGIACTKDRYNNIKVNSDNTINIHPVKDSYSRDEVESILAKYAEDEWAVFSSVQDIEKFNNWIKNNLP